MLEVKFKLKELLEERNLTQKELAKLSNVREATISEISRGTRTVINFKHLAAIANALNITDIQQIMVLEKIEK
ncbi:XRE family transcriptional regulator [Bacillus toyonensis]|uniref:helix-turn-helix domain-containing protein n=1 Tax=Bacillus toyonensis TaxID=155322 RepID=UPI00030B4C25|nr:helix-turn-helix transcriptional regulator [Bacillus toyonensis]PEJ62415.1 XRE family transcriptional regulator [Bacillus toyonensis]PGB31887.1 XRE family transcriptional regulator [Bacillus toyonensis]PHG54326.1 XRE family transcriptional regulator [Bacillus toyonensis]PKR92790.1 DNA repair protein [Bacillus cereus Rock4-18]